MIKQIILYYTILQKKKGKYEFFNNSNTEQLKTLHSTEIINFIWCCPTMLSFQKSL